MCVASWRDVRAALVENAPAELGGQRRYDDLTRSTATADDSPEAEGRHDRKEDITPVKRTNTEKLTLRKETLRDLNRVELERAAGGLTPYIKTLPPDQCVVVPTAGGECIPA